MRATCVIVMPAYNEQDCIGRVCQEWLSVVESFPGARLLVVNDGSTDRTPEILEELARRHPALMVLRQSNTGHGGAVLHGYRTALEMGCEWVCQVDGDGQLDARDFARLQEAAARCRCVLGYRVGRKDPVHRRWLSAGLRLLIAIVFGVRIRDPNVPFRLMEARYLAELLPLLPENAFAPNIFLSILARRRGHDLCEVPVSHLERRAGRGSLRGVRLLRVLARCLRELIVFRLSRRWLSRGELTHAAKS